jgi:hypothetical protein
MPVIEEVYLREKRWIDDPAAEIPPAPAAVADRSWFLVTVEGEPAGVLRLVYDPPLEMPAELGVTFEREVDLDAFRRASRVVDVGRLMILPRLILDIARAYERMKRRKNRLFREFTDGVREVMEARRLRSA